MACQITFKHQEVQLNNRQFSRLIEFAIEIAERTVSTENRAFVNRMKELRDTCVWPGRGIEIENDFPELLERKYWCQVFYDVSRAIFERTVGQHDNLFWQAQAIHQSHGTGLIFEHAVRDVEPRWFADTIDRREFDTIVNGNAG